MADTARSAAALKLFFETGDVPTQQQFADFISSYANTVDGNLLTLNDIAITAHAGGGQASAYQITKLVSQITTCATAGDSVKLPTALTGTNGLILNATATSANVYPDSGSNFANGAADAPIALSAFYMLYYYCVYPGQWLFYVVSGSGNFVQVPNVNTSASTLTPSLGIANTYSFTALAAGLTINAPTAPFGTGQPLSIIIKDDGTSRALTWNAAYVAASGSLPTATIAGKQMIFMFKYVAATSKWFCIATSVEGYTPSQTLVYRALLTQTGTSAPTAVVLENTLGVVPTYSYVGVGNYTLTATGVVTAGKMFARAQAALTGGYWVSVNTLSSPNTVQIQSFNNIGGGVNAVLSSTPIEIIIYP